MNTSKLLRSLPLFDDFSDAELEVLSVVFAVREYNYGDIISRMGLPGPSFYVIVSGTVEIYRENAQDKKRILGTLGAGHLLGEVSIVDGGPRLAFAAARDSVVALEMDRSNFERLFESNNRFAYKLLDLILKDLSFRLRLANKGLKELHEQEANLSRELKRDTYQKIQAGLHTGTSIPAVKPGQKDK